MAGLGGYTVDGFVVGIVGGKQDVYKAAQDLIEAAPEWRRWLYTQCSYQ